MAAREVSEATLARNGEETVMRYILSVGLYLICATMAVDAQDIHFSIEANAETYRIGQPMLVKLELKNNGAARYTIIGAIGWGKGMSILKAHGDEDPTAIRPEVPELCTDLGGMFRPVYWIKGELAPGEGQSIRQIIPTRDWTPGRTRLTARTVQLTRKLIAEEIAVTLLTKEETEPGVFTREEEAVLYRRVASLHNNPNSQPNRDGVTKLARKALRSKAATMNVEYALYAGLLQGTQGKPGVPELELAEEAGQALLDRFPDSLLRATTSAFLGDVRADLAARAGDIRFSIEANAETYRAGQPILVRLTVRNDSATPLSLRSILRWVKEVGLLKAHGDGDMEPIRSGEPVTGVVFGGGATARSMRSAANLRPVRG